MKLANDLNNNIPDKQTLLALQEQMRKITEAKETFLITEIETKLDPSYIDLIKKYLGPEKMFVEQVLGDAMYFDRVSTILLNIMNTVETAADNISKIPIPKDNVQLSTLLKEMDRIMSDPTIYTSFIVAKAVPDSKPEIVMKLLANYNQEINAINDAAKTIFSQALETLKNLPIVEVKVTANEGAKAQIVCPVGKYIVGGKYKYGRWDPYPVTVPSGFSTVTNYVTPDPAKYETVDIPSDALLKSSYELAINNATFGSDPYDRMVKQAEINVQCK